MAMKPKPLKGDKISIRLEPEIRRALEKLAAAADRSLSDFIRVELKKLITNKGGK